LIAQGHSHAGRYPLGKLWSEKEITKRRVDNEVANQATVDKASQAAVHGGKEGHSLFKSVIRRLTGEQ